MTSLKRHGLSGSGGGGGGGSGEGQGAQERGAGCNSNCHSTDSKGEVPRATARGTSPHTASTPLDGGRAYSHSIVPGGFDVTSSTTRFTSGTWFVILFEMRASTSYGTRVQSAVIASSEETGRSTIG